MKLHHAYIQLHEDHVCDNTYTFKYAWYMNITFPFPGSRDLEIFCYMEITIYYMSALVNIVVLSGLRYDFGEVKSRQLLCNCPEAGLYW